MPQLSVVNRTNRRRRPIAIDLFSGCGGMTLGMRQAGYRVVGAVEIDPLAVETYGLNHPRVTVWPIDIRRLKVSQVKRELNVRRGELDLLAACPPCEGFSTLRTLNGSRTVVDPDNDLIYQVMRFVRRLLPSRLVLENVPNLAYDVRMSVVQQQLVRLGYRYCLRVVDAADYGVPQRRRRMMLVASRTGPIELPIVDGRHVTVRQALEDIPTQKRSRDRLHRIQERRSDRVMNLIRAIPRDGGSRGDLPEEDQLPCHRRCDGFKDVYGRMAWDSPAPTITGGCVNPSKGRFLHPEEDRAVTLREAALLQGFPRTYRFSLARGKFAAADMIGNAVPPGLIQGILTASGRSQSVGLEGGPS